MHWLSKRRIMVLMILPTLALYLLFIIIPVFVTIFYSFTKFSGIGSPEFLGFTNYTNLFQDKFFFIALKKLCDNPTVHGCRFDPWVFWTSTFIGKTFPWKQFDQGNGFFSKRHRSYPSRLDVGLYFGSSYGSGQCLSTANRAGKLAAGVDRRPNPDSLLCSFGLYLAGAWVLCHDFLGWFKNNLSGYL